MRETEKSNEIAQILLLHHRGVGGEGITRGVWLHAGIIECGSDFYRHDAEARDWLQKWADCLEALTVRNVVPLRAA